MKTYIWSTGFEYRCTVVELDMCYSIINCGNTLWVFTQKWVMSQPHYTVHSCYLMMQSNINTQEWGGYTSLYAVSVLSRGRTPTEWMNITKGFFILVYMILSR